jgi:uncharacterized protein YdeI (YjbR/CyaY-like superfamily)
MTETVNGVPAVHATTVDEWRAWLAENGRSARSVWLIIYHKRSPIPSPLFGEAVEHALCFGWVDSKAIRRDAESFYLTFSPRNPKSTWSLVNRERVRRLTEAGLMMPEGQAMIDMAKRTGTWDCLAAAQNGIEPDDLRALLDADPTAAQHFRAFPPSARRLILQWIAKAKRPETRQRRLARTVELARQNIRAPH